MALSSTENGKESNETTSICYQHGKPVIREAAKRHQRPGDTLMHSWRAVGNGLRGTRKQAVLFSLFPAAADRLFRLTRHCRSASERG
jgi:hypothetical protein